MAKRSAKNGPQTHTFKVKSTQCTKHTRRKVLNVQNIQRRTSGGFRPDKKVPYSSIRLRLFRVKFPFLSRNFYSHRIEPPKREETILFTLNV